MTVTIRNETAATHCAGIELGVFYQLNPDAGVVVCDEYMLPPMALAEPLVPEGWAFLGEVLDFETKQGGWYEVYVYEREK